MTPPVSPVSQKKGFLLPPSVQSHRCLRQCRTSLTTPSHQYPSGPRQTLQCLPQWTSPDFPTHPPTVHRDTQFKVLLPGRPRLCVVAGPYTNDPFFVGRLRSHVPGTPITNLHSNFSLQSLSDRLPETYSSITQTQTQTPVTSETTKNFVQLQHWST